MRQAVFFDRDGVLNRLVEKICCGCIVFDSSPNRFEDFKLTDSAKEVIKIFKSLGFLNIVVTNQPDIARHLMEVEELAKMHDYIYQNLLVDDIFICTHDDIDDCPCRKPKSGMLTEAAKKWDIDLCKSFLIGDSWKDIEAGKNVGCKTILLDNSWNKKTIAEFRVTNLLDATKIVLGIKGNN